MCKQNLKTNETEAHALETSAWKKDISCHRDTAQNTSEQRHQFSDLLEDLRLEQQELH